MVVKHYGVKMKYKPPRMPLDKVTKDDSIQQAIVDAVLKEVEDEYAAHLAKKLAVIAAPSDAAYRERIEQFQDQQFTKDVQQAVAEGFVEVRDGRP